MANNAITWNATALAINPVETGKKRYWRKFGEIGLWIATVFYDLMDEH
jgi:hypothetical protein